MSVAELQALLAEVQDQEANELRAREELEDQTRFFHEPRAQADFSHWSKMPRLILDEATALALGKAPEVVNWDSVKVHLPVSPFAKKYEQMRALVLRANEAGELETNVRLGDFLSWAECKGVGLPEQLKVAVYAVEERIESFENLKAERDELKKRLAELEAERKSEKPLGTRERKTLLQMILGMAIDKYGYKKDSQHQHAPAAIAASLKRRELSVTDDTIRKYLKEAAEGLP